jgi:hypothetical protein
MPKDNWERAGIIGQLVNVVLVGIIGLLIKTGADNISASYKKGELVQSLISDLAAEDPKNIRQDVALIALNHSLGDQEKQLIIDIAQQIVQENSYNKVAGSVAYRILEQRAPTIAQNIRDRALLLAASPTVTMEIRSNANPAALTGPTPRPSPEAAAAEKQFMAKVLPNLILVQFRNEQSRAVFDELRQVLNRNGLIVPGPDRVDASFTSSIRFFHEEDRALAERVFDETKKFFQARQISVNPTMQNFSKSNFKALSGQIEIWIDL